MLSTGHVTENKAAFPLGYLRAHLSLLSTWALSGNFYSQVDIRCWGGETEFPGKPWAIIFSVILWNSWLSIPGWSHWNVTYVKPSQALVQCRHISLAAVWHPRSLSSKWTLCSSNGDCHIKLQKKFQPEKKNLLTWTLWQGHVSYSIIFKSTSQQKSFSKILEIPSADLDKHMMVKFGAHFCYHTLCLSQTFDIINKTLLFKNLIFCIQLSSQS